MSDIGTDVVDCIYDFMKIDGEWSVRKERGFSWWGSQLAQHVWAEPCYDDDGVILTRVHCRTDLIDNYTGSESQLAWLSEAMRLVSLNGPIRTPDNRIQLASSLYIHAEVQQWLQKIMSWIAGIQIAEVWQFLLLSGQNDVQLLPAQSQHPNSGLRTEPDDMMNLLQEVVIPAGEGASQWAEEDFEDLKKMLQRPPTVMITGDDTGITVEFPFPQYTSLLRVMTEQAHPILGSGCLILITVPVGTDDEESMDHALKLNEMESQHQTHSHFIGSWCPDKQGLTYVTFLPNAMYFRGSIVSLVMSAIGRIRWITEQVYEYDMMENFEESFRKKMESLGLSANGLPYSS